MRARRVFVIALTFFCVGALIETVLWAIALFCWAASMFCLVFFLTGATNRVGDARLVSDLTYDFIRHGLFLDLLVWAMAWAGLTGLIAGIYEMLFGRTNARVMLDISFAIAFARLILSIVVGALSAANVGHNLDHGSVYLGPIVTSVGLAMKFGANFLLWVLGISAAESFCFVASMMACWKLIDIARDRIPAAGRLLGQ
jgi:hypothetical protein